MLYEVITPAGLTAAYELLEKTDIMPIIFEMDSDVGGISKTINYKGNRIDIGGHRFFRITSYNVCYTKLLRVSMIIDTLLFDLDGTLVDSVRDLTTATNLLRNELDLPSLPLAKVRVCVGDGATQLVKCALPEVPSYNFV